MTLKSRSLFLQLSNQAMTNTSTVSSSTINEAKASSSSYKLATTEKAADILSNYLKSTTRQLSQQQQQQQQQQSLLFERVSCCNSSRSLYCSECCTVLIPSHYWPESIQNNNLDLPFDVHVILDKKERRTSSTGLQLTALFRSMRKNNHNHNHNNENYTKKQQQNRRDTTATAAITTTIVDNDSGDSTGEVDNEENVLDSTSNGSTTKAALDDEKSRQKENKELLFIDDKRKNNLSTVELYDLERVEIPMYNCNDPKKYNNNNNINGVYVLFPDKDSIPISQVVASTKNKIQTLIVLDMKWSSQTVKLHPNLMNLPKVHLTNPPSQSHFWRWHTSGRGMLSTIEAIYFASMEVLESTSSSSSSSTTTTTTTTATTQTSSRSTTATTYYNNNNNDRQQQQQQQQNNENDINCSTIDTNTNTNTNNIIDMMWLFALQYSVVHDRSQQEQRILPFTEEGKNRNRELRQKQNGNPTKKKQLGESFY